MQYKRKNEQSKANKPEQAGVSPQTVAEDIDDSHSLYELGTTPAILDEFDMSKVDKSIEPFMSPDPLPGQEMEVAGTLPAESTLGFDVVDERPASLEDYLDGDRKYAKRTEPELLNWGGWIR